MKRATSYSIHDEHDGRLLTVVLGYGALDAIRAAQRAELIGFVLSFRVVNGTSIYIV